MNFNSSSKIIYTLTAKCRDCYRCLRNCPVKAIGIKDGQAYVDEKRCILCGTCIRECPQGAKTFRQDTDKVKFLISNKEQVAVSLAPSFASVYSNWQAYRLPSALRKLGFCYIAETSEGAYRVAKTCLEQVRTPDNTANICTACPAVVNYVEKYKPKMLDKLLPVVSPMIAHAKILKNNLGNKLKVVFIGPCIAKKAEAERPEFAGIVDAVLTFKELDAWLEAENIVLANCAESGFDSIKLDWKSRFFPLPGGLLKTVDIANDGVSLDIIHTSSSERIHELFDSIATDHTCDLIEPLYCTEGCINGPGISSKKNIFERRSDLISYVNRQPKLSGAPLPDVPVNLSTSFEPQDDFNQKPITEDEILSVMAKTGKADPANQLNCGACGYKSCRDKAIAVIRGMAEPEMCIPYMRLMAEQRTDRIIETSPSGIVILDENLTIIGMNPAFRKLFLCSDDTLGRKISYLMDADGYEKIAAGSAEIVESVINHYGSEFHQLIYALRPEKQYVGIYMDITSIRLDEKKLNKIKMQTVEQAKELLEHQIKMAQDMTRYLGESTARGEELVWRLMNIYDDKK